MNILTNTTLGYHAIITPSGIVKKFAAVMVVLPVVLVEIVAKVLNLNSQRPYGLLIPILLVNGVDGLTVWVMMEMTMT